ncbi:MAG: Spy/CpxP family protein refolding chaperone [Xanthobacteraceae bacterium]|nr:Spy/CpxP family protein refolding chaperone [Xanthobacteraceae bacterium]
MSANYHGQHGRRAAKRLARLAALTAWQLGVLAPYVPWRGPVYWPYAYSDVFYYTFWPDAYDPGYWAYAYDDFFDGVFFPDGAPYVEYAADGPYEGYGSYGARTTTSGARGSSYSGGPAQRSRGAAAPGRISQATRDFCADQATGVTAWPINKIADAVQPSSEQKGLLDNLRKASQEAAAQFRDACPESVPMTPPGRLQAMTQRLQATADAVSIVKPALEAFTNSLSDEQKARFNEIGPQLARSQQGSQRRPQTAAADAEPSDAQANCSSEKAGLSNIAIERIEELVQPTEAQEASLDRLDDAMQKAVDVLREACPNTQPMTPVGRLEAMKQRLDAMIQAANTVRPALEDFYAALTDEQKATFNRLGRQTAQSGG